MPTSKLCLPPPETQPLVKVIVPIYHNSHDPSSTSSTRPPLIALASRSERIGFLFMLASVVIASATVTLYRLSVSTYGLPVFPAVFLRGFAMTLVSLIAIPFTTDVRRESFGGRKVILLLLIRGILGGLNYLLYIYSLAYLPAGDGSGLHATGAVFTALLSAYLLQEHMSLPEIAAILVASAGVFLVASPNVGGSTTAAATTDRLMGAALGLSSSLLSAFSAVATRGLGEKVSCFTAVLAHGAFSALFGMAGCWMTGTTFNWMDLDMRVGALAMIAAGAIGFVEQAFYARGLQLARAGPGTAIANQNGPIVYVLGVAFLHEIPNWTRLMGSFLAIASASFLASRTSR